MHSGRPKPGQAEGSSGSKVVGSTFSGVGTTVDKGLHVYHMVHRVRDGLGAGILTTIQAGFHWLHDVGVSFWVAFVFTLPLTLAVAVSVFLWKLIGLDSTLRGMGKLFAWSIGFSVVLGLFTGVGEKFVQLSVDAGDYSQTLNALGANNAMDSQIHQFVSSLSHIRGFGAAIAGLIESVYVYGLGNMIFSLIVGCLLGWLGTTVIERFANRGQA
jgi:hypothetical protein